MAVRVSAALELRRDGAEEGYRRRIQEGCRESGTPLRRREHLAPSYHWFSVAGLLLGVHWFGIEGWRWLFVVEGVPPALLGVFTIFYLPDQPSSATWLNDDERTCLTRTLAEEKRIQVAGQSHSVWQALRCRPAILLGTIAFLAFSAGYAFYFGSRPY
jgi:MFS family permease